MVRTSAVEPIRRAGERIRSFTKHFGTTFELSRTFQHSLWVCSSTMEQIISSAEQLMSSTKIEIQNVIEPLKIQLS